jgi:tetratricopeptide (TPR) repeat protein
MSETPFPAGPIFAVAEGGPVAPREESPLHSVGRVRRRITGFVLILLLLGMVSVGAYFAVRHWRAEYAFRAAEKARQQRNFPQARVYLDQCLAVWPESSRVHFLMARVARQAGFYEEAERRLDICQRLQGPSPDVQLERALIQVQQGAFAALTESQLRDQVAREHPAREHILEALARGCMRTFRLTSAQTCLELWLERQPDNFQALLWLGWVHEHLYEFAHARKDYERALEMRPEDDEARLHLAQVLLLSGELTAACEHFASLREREPENPVIGLGLGQCLGKLGRTQEAQRLLDDLVARYPKDGPVLLERGRLALESARADQAEGWLRRAAILAPRDYQTNYTLFLCYRELRRDGEARALEARVSSIQADLVRLHELTEQAQAHPYDLDCRCDIGKIFLQTGDTQEGVAWLKNVLRVDPEHGEANRVLAEYYEKTGQPTLAELHRSSPRPN